MYAHRIRAAGLGGSGALASVTFAWLLARGVVEHWPATDTVDVAVGLGLVATLLASVLLAWIGMVLTAASISVLRESSPLPRGHGRPATVTARVAAGLLAAAAVGLSPAVASAAPLGVGHGVSLRTTPAPANASADAHPHGAPEQLSARPDDPVDLPQPGWTPTSAAPVAPAPPRAGEVALVSTAPSVKGSESSHVVVTRGDTLWGIAARHLGEDATDQDVAEAWPRWYAVNAEVIGPDPNFILPGQQLVVPGVTP